MLYQTTLPFVASPTLLTLGCDILRELDERFLGPREVNRLRRTCRFMAARRVHPAIGLLGMVAQAKPLYERCRLVAQTGCLQALRWARAGGWPWGLEGGVFVCLELASYGHLDLLKWALEQGCAWDERTCM